MDGSRLVSSRPELQDALLDSTPLPRTPYGYPQCAARSALCWACSTKTSNVLAYRTKINTLLGLQHHESQLRPRPACSGVVVKMSLPWIDLSHIDAAGTIVSFGSRKESDSQGRIEPMHLWRRKVLCQNSPLSSNSKLAHEK
jgi:hypothetical protein